MRRGEAVEGISAGSVCLVSVLVSSVFKASNSLSNSWSASVHSKIVSSIFGSAISGISGLVLAEIGISVEIASSDIFLGSTLGFAGCLLVFSASNWAILVSILFLIISSMYSSHSLVGKMSVLTLKFSSWSFLLVKDISISFEKKKLTICGTIFHLSNSSVLILLTSSNVTLFILDIRSLKA